MLAGGNESARVSAVKLLADVDAFSREGGAERDFRAEVRAEMEQHAEEADRMISKLILNAVAGIVLGEDLSTQPAWVSTMRDNLDADTKQAVAALKAERQALEDEIAGVWLQRQEFRAA